MGEIAAVLNTLRERWTERHGLAIADLRVGADGAPEGSVLTRRQKSDMAAALPDTPLTRVLVLEDPSTPAPGWRAIPGDAPVALHRSPALTKLTTEATPADSVLRWLGNWGADLVQTDDGAIAWAAPETLPPCEAPDSWPNLPRLGPDETRTSQEHTVEALAAAGRTWLGTPYVLGGCSRTRIDCSGLMSRLLRETCQVILPRHSMDQRRCGDRISRGEMRAGDLIFARLIDTRTAHVGLLVQGKGEEFEVLHASQRAGKVVSESLSDFETGYRFMGARRVLEEAGS